MRILVIDVGSSSVRANLYDRRARLVVENAVAVRVLPKVAINALHPLL